MTAIDVAVIGAGAAGLATAIFVRELDPDVRVVMFDGARTPGAKILVSGGSRCNVTNVVVTERDFNGGSPAAIRRVLRAWPADRTARFFTDLGVSLHEEPGGKLFPDSGRSRDVLDALLGARERAGAELRAGQRVTSVRRNGSGFTLTTSDGPVEARRVVLATGGLSLPKTGSDGAGYAFARHLGHTIVSTTPALVPLVLSDAAGASHASPAAPAAATRPIHATLSGVAHPVRLTLRRAGVRLRDIDGPMLWTHFGISGPAALDMSRHWLRAHLDAGATAGARRPAGPPDEAPQASIRLTAALTPGQTFESLEAIWTTWIATGPRTAVLTVLGGMLPASVATAVLAELAINGRQPLASFTRDDRRRLVHALLAWPLPVQDSRGYTYAEVTAGGVDLAEVDTRTMESRVCPGLFLVGEILDVDGRLGGFNFQWAWSSARAAATGLARRGPPVPRP
jgi:predicted flavoprotein YhiN